MHIRTYSQLYSRSKVIINVGAPAARGQAWTAPAAVLKRDVTSLASDYPHPDSTWPDSQRAIEENLGRAAPATRQRILCDNARQLYGL